MSVRPLRWFATALFTAGCPLVLAACSYRAADGTAAVASTYQADLTACQEFGEKEGHRRVKAYGGYFLTYPVSLPIQEWLQTRKCMTGKGYQATL